MMRATAPCGTKNSSTLPKQMTTSVRIGLCHALLVMIILISACALPTTSSNLPTPTLTAAPKDCAHAAQALNPVEVENTCPGDTSWKVDYPIGPENAIEGFVTPASINIGESLQLYVSTTAPDFVYSIYRMGWYGGKGGRLVSTSQAITGVNQPPPLLDPATHKVSCDNWTSPVTISIPNNWVSGFYIIKLVSAEGYMRYTPFIVRNDDSRAPILYTASFITYQAYNSWGGYSLYRGADPGPADIGSERVASQRAFAVSFDRPYDQHNGLMDFASYEYGLLRWLERQSYNMTYAADVDLDALGVQLRQHRLLLISGHDEYWSTHMRTNVTAARDDGVSLAFFGANDIYWHIRLQDSPLGPKRDIVCYKHGYYDDGARDSTDPVAAADPRESTVLWSDPPLSQPEDSLLGEKYHGGVVDLAPLVIAEGAAPYLGSTQLTPGSSVPGIVGWEYDRYIASATTPPSVTILTSSPVQCKPTNLCPADGQDSGNATIYTTTSGAMVFDAGTFLWGRGLDPGMDSEDAVYTSPALQRLTVNVLTTLIKASRFK